MVCSSSWVSPFSIRHLCCRRSIFSCISKDLFKFNISKDLFIILRSSHLQRSLQVDVNLEDGYDVVENVAEGGMASYCIAS